MPEKVLINAVLDRDVEAVKKLIEDGYPLEERDFKGRTALRFATASEQYIIAELLVEAGADVFTMDSLYITAAGGVYKSFLVEGNPDGDARQRLLKLFADKGVPFPPPNRDEMPEALRDGRWPAHAAPPPIKYD
ncbi:MAG: hypothetical protein HKN36_09320 [Hellea sp.]|nr:hypothetical protein [Hellea sp.]